MSALRAGISPCPNDTFVFHGLLSGAVRAAGEELDFALCDVEELNRRMLAGALDVAKVSSHAALALAERVFVLASGAALGVGVGPLLLAAPGRGRPADEPRPPLVLCPGAWTTAHLLWRAFHPEPARVRQVTFSDILPALARGEADLGVCIHEGRFTYPRFGLTCVEDLGARWERETGEALPLGVIVCRRELGRARAAALRDAIAASLAHARREPEAALATMRRHASEHEDAVLWQHVELYVNEHTRALGAAGERALGALERLARARGILAAEARLEIV